MCAVQDESRSRDQLPGRVGAEGAGAAAPSPAAAPSGFPDAVYDQLLDKFSGWQITRGAGMITAEREGFTTRRAQSALVMLAVLADAEMNDLKAPLPQERAAREARRRA